MCECGCGELRPIGKLRARGGWYAIELYPGCANCGNTTWGLGITFLKNSDPDTRDLLRGVEEIRFDARGQWGVPILDAGVLRRIMKANAIPEEWESVEFALDEMMSQGGFQALYRDSLATGSGSSAVGPEAR